MPANNEAYHIAKCKEFLENYSNFSWFIIEYFGKKKLQELIEYATSVPNRGFALMTELNNIWSTLPDSKFNIRENPDGWNEFLHIIED